MRKIRYGRLFNLGNYENEKIEVEEEFDELETDMSAIQYLALKIESMQKELVLSRELAVQKLRVERQKEIEKREELRKPIFEEREKLQERLRELDRKLDRIESDIVDDEN